MSAITENGKNGHSSPKTHPRAKLPITDSPKVWVSGFPSVDRNAKLVSAIMENGKHGRSSLKTHPRAKLPITNPPYESVPEQRFSFYPTSHLCVVLHFLIFSHCYNNFSRSLFVQKHLNTLGDCYDCLTIPFGKSHGLLFIKKNCLSVLPRPFPCSLLDTKPDILQNFD